MSEVSAGSPSAGRLLRQAREAAGMHVAALAVSLKVPVRKLEALEDDRYDELPDAVFARALASSVCRTLKVDPQPVLERLPQGSAPRLAPDHVGINTPFRAPGDAPGPSWFDHLTRPVFLVVFGLLIAALVLVLLPSVRREEASLARGEAPGTPVAAPVRLPAETPEAPPAEAAVVVPVSTTVTALAAPAAAPASASPAPVAGPSVSSLAGAPVPSGAGALPSTGLVVFKATGPSWVQVTDAKGTVALRRLLAAGETAGASGSPPLAVTVGSVSTTAVEVRGKPFDLAPVSRDNVARFEIK